MNFYLILTVASIVLINQVIAVCETRPYNDGHHCTSNSDCKSEVCNQATWKCGLSKEGDSCSNSDECALPSNCRDGFCLLPSSQECTDDSECASNVCHEFYRRCVISTIRARCQREKECAGGLTCVSGFCLRQDGEPCRNDDDDCANGVCNTLTGRCGYSSGGGSCSRDKECAAGSTCDESSSRCLLLNSESCNADFNCLDRICNQLTRRCGRGVENDVCKRTVECEAQFVCDENNQKMHSAIIQFEA